MSGNNREVVSQSAAGPQNAEVSKANKSGMRIEISPKPMAGMDGMVVRYAIGRTWARRPQASMKRAKSSMLMTELKVERMLLRKAGRGEEYT